MSTHATKLATSLVFIKRPRNAQMKRLTNRKIMIFKLVVATYITSKVAFFIQPSIIPLPHIIQQVVLLPRAILQHHLPYVHMLQQEKTQTI